MNGGKYKNELVKNTVWNALENYSMIGIQLLCTFILARYLTPADFGIVGMLVVFTAISQTLVDSGFGAALIREKEVSQKGYSSVFYANLFVSLCLYYILYVCSGAIAHFYNQPILDEICKYSFLVLPLNALCIVQTTILRRELCFKKLCVITVTAALLSSIVAIVSAYFLKNVWALVIQNVSLFGFRTLFLWLSSRWHPTLDFSWQLICKYFSFSKNILVAGLVGSIFNNIYSLLIGKYYTASDLGYFSQADRVKNVASHTSTSVVQNVTYPILSRVNNEGGDLLHAYKKIICVTMLFVGCIMAFVIGISSDLFEVLMGSAAWRRSGFYFLLLGISGILFPLHAVNQNILMVVGKSKTLMYLEIARRCIMMLILLFTVRYDISIFVFGNSIYSIILLFLNLHYCGQPIHYTIAQQLKDVAPILLRQGLIIALGLSVTYLLSQQAIYLRLLLAMASMTLLGYYLFRNNNYYKEIKAYMIQRMHGH